jgi:transposase
MDPYCQSLQLAGRQMLDCTRWLQVSSIGWLSATFPSAIETRHPDFDRDMYRRRNVIERLVGWRKCRRLFARYEKTALNFLGSIKMGFVLYYLRLFCPE